MIKKKGNFVYKTNKRLNYEWKEKFVLIMEYVYFPAFVKFIPNGYVAKYINGIDLQEDKPFKPRHDIIRSYNLSATQKKKIIEIWKDVLLAGVRTGFFLGDITRRNFLVKKDEVYLIDYDVIIEKFNSDYIKIYQTMLDYLCLSYRFNGDAQKLYEYLNRLSSRGLI